MRFRIIHLLGAVGVIGVCTFAARQRFDALHPCRAAVNDVLAFGGIVRYRSAPPTLMSQLWSDSQFVTTVESVEVPEQFPAIRIHANASSKSDLSITCLKSFPRLTVFRAERCRLNDLWPLAGLPLADIDISYTPVSDLTPLEGMNIGILNAHHTNVATLASFNVGRLVVSDGPLSDLSGFGGNVGTLDISRTRVTDISGLLSADFIGGLIADGTAIANFRPLRGLEHLEVLSLNDTKFWRIEVLSTHTELRELYICNTYVTDLAPIASLPYVEVWIDESQNHIRIPPELAGRVHVLPTDAHGRPEGVVEVGPSQSKRRKRQPNRRVGLSERQEKPASTSRSEVTQLIEDAVWRAKKDLSDMKSKAPHRIGEAASWIRPTTRVLDALKTNREKTVTALKALTLNQQRAQLLAVASDSESEAASILLKANELLASAKEHVALGGASEAKGSQFEASRQLDFGRSAFERATLQYEAAVKAAEKAKSMFAKAKDLANEGKTALNGLRESLGRDAPDLSW